ncbi:MAG: carboxypeptidase regulatory-like domain-containing protein [Verrucomicrobiota bacterium]
MNSHETDGMRRHLSISIGAAGAAFVLLAGSPAAKAADIYGTITYQGKPPPEIPIRPLKNDLICGPLHKEMPTTHFYVVGPHGEFGDVVVSLAGIHGKSTGAEAGPLHIDQKGCEYIPYVSAGQTGEKIVVKNSDPVLHNVHVTPRNRGNKEQNRAQMANSPDLTFEFTAPENFLRFKCDVHPWMFAYVSLFDHPYFSVTGDGGSYRIHNVPPGQYTVASMHRKAGTLKKKVEVKGQDVKLDFTFERKGGR